MFTRLLEMRQQALLELRVLGALGTALQLLDRVLLHAVRVFEIVDDLLTNVLVSHGEKLLQLFVGHVRRTPWESGSRGRRREAVCLATTGFAPRATG